MKAIEIMIKDFDKIFDEDWYGPNVEMSDEDIERSAEPEIEESDAALESLRRQLISKSLMKLDRENLISILGLQRPDRKPPQLEPQEE